MDRLIYTSASAMRGIMSRQTTTANNLANVGTAGFKGELATMSPLFVEGQGLQSRALSTEGVIAADMKAGAVTHTGRELDVALSGDALLAVQAEDGAEGYTRRGDLKLSDSGLLTNGEGLPVLGDGGPITLPPADKIQIDAGGAIWVRPTGADPALPMQKVEQLKLVSPKGSTISKTLDGLFRVTGGGALPSDPGARLASGSLEGSNVDASTGLIEMIEASRAWEAQIKLVTTAKELDSSTADLMRVE